MRIRIGTAVDGSPLRLDTGSGQLVLVVGDPGTGKTTLARFVLRWWIASERPATVLTARRGEYTCCHGGTRPQLEVRDTSQGRGRTTLIEGRARSHQSVRCTDLMIVDDSDRLDQPLLAELVQLRRRCASLTLVTSHGPAARHLESSADLALGLLARTCTDAEATQGRLDWPSTAIPVRPDTRGNQDLPVHRWQSTLPVARPLVGGGE